MAIYSRAERLTNFTITQACLEIIAAAANQPRILEIGFTLNAATGVAVGFGKSAAVGVTPAGGGVVATEDGGNTSAGLSTTALSWATSPTVPAPHNRRCSLPATIGAGFIWTFPRGFALLKATSAVFWNITTNVAADAWVVLDE